MAKFELVREFGLGGVSYWTVNNPFMQNWTMIDALWRVKKV
jgi:spore germination protein